MLVRVGEATVAVTSLTAQVDFGSVAALTTTAVLGRRLVQRLIGKR